MLPDVSLAVAPGEVLGILGPNGAGKTTLLKTLLGLLPPVRGAISVPAGRARVRFGYVPQRQVVDETFPLTAADVVLMGRYGLLRPGRRPGRDDHAATLRALAEVGMADQARRLYRELSGGQKQRVAIARALAGQPTVLVLDEPTTDMDLGSERAILELIQRLRAEHGLTVLVVSHLLHVVLTLATRVALVDRRVEVLPVEDARGSEVLSAFYGVRVQVHAINGMHVVV
ncbi:MAG TPA: ATP-binding cassette domain-containing protein [Armatimonadota bacterium]|nr:ATP-binding cassette domain-containing protein [Armatimonadota bacterium]